MRIIWGPEVTGVWAYDTDKYVIFLGKEKLVFQVCTRYVRQEEEKHALSIRFISKVIF